MPIHSEFPRYRFDARLARLLSEIEERFDAMSDTTGHEEGSVGELRGQVRGLFAGFDSLGKKVDDGIRGLTDAIAKQGERFDQRITDQAQRTDQRFEALAQAQLAQLGARGQNYSANIAVVISSVLGLASLAFTMFTLVKSPIDASFARQDAAIGQVSSDSKLIATSLQQLAKDNRNDLDAAVDKARIAAETNLKAAEAKFVPKEQVNGELNELIKRVDGIGARQREADLKLATVGAYVEKNTALIGDIRADQKEDRSHAATKNQISDLNERVTTISNRVQTIYDKAYTPNTPPASPPPTAGTVGR